MFHGLRTRNAIAGEHTLADALPRIRAAGGSCAGGSAVLSISLLRIAYARHSEKEAFIELEQRIERISSRTTPAVASDHDRSVGLVLAILLLAMIVPMAVVRYHWHRVSVKKLTAEVAAKRAYHAAFAADLKVLNADQDEFDNADKALTNAQDIETQIAAIKAELADLRRMASDVERFEVDHGQDLIADKTLNILTKWQVLEWDYAFNVSAAVRSNAYDKYAVDSIPLGVTAGDMTGNMMVLGFGLDDDAHAAQNALNAEQQKPWYRILTSSPAK